MKKLNKTSFWVLLSALSASIVFKIVQTIQAKFSDFDRLVERFQLDQTTLEKLRELSFQLNIFGTIVFALILSYFFYRVVSNFKNEAKQGYINFLFVVCIVFAVFNCLSLLTGNLLTLVNLAINGAIVAGCVIQKKYQPEDEYQTENLA